MTTAATTAAMTIIRCSANQLTIDAAELGVLLHDCVHAGTSIGFVQPVTPADGYAFWTDSVLPALQAGRRMVWVAHFYNDAERERGGYLSEDRQGKKVFYSLISLSIGAICVDAHHEIASAAAEAKRQAKKLHVWQTDG